ncbi:TetR family transcriptional regulator [Geomonas limicola]|uniref:TetR family transcriptional regulator n=1 Tax=Geomonas limicola TaxID=2740186 RepID=A0A6V8N9L9_9BACT|nr:TetR/AcrR family transcriptional regulator [Geomonas limicola]GFO69286.1 TetR family transcriptional regulator [Geomonas limicola]
MRVKTDAKRRAIIEEAGKVFNAVGFERASMAEICTRVGGSRTTVYNYFPSKQELFIAVVIESVAAEYEAVHQPFEEQVEDVGEALRCYGERFIALIYSPKIVVTRHMMIAQAKHSKAVHELYEQGALRSQQLIAQFLEPLMAAGRLRPADPLIAASHLISLLETEFRHLLLLDSPEVLSNEVIREGTRRAVEVFMGGYGAAPVRGKDD